MCSVAHGSSSLTMEGDIVHGIVNDGGAASFTNVVATNLTVTRVEDTRGVWGVYPKDGAATFTTGIAGNNNSVTNVYYVFPPANDLPAPADYIGFISDSWENHPNIGWVRLRHMQWTTIP